jgi:hypothetical protein
VAATCSIGASTMWCMRLGIAHHFGWAVAVTASADHAVVDRRRLELIEDDLPPAPIHHMGGAHPLHGADALGDDALGALVADVRASVARAARAALDDLDCSLTGPIVSISVRAWPADFPTDIAISAACRTRPAPIPSCTARPSPRSPASVDGRSTATTRCAWRAKRPGFWERGRPMSSAVLALGSGRRGAKTSGPRSRRRSSLPASCLDSDRCRGVSCLHRQYCRRSTHIVQDVGLLVTGQDRFWPSVPPGGRSSPS